MRKLLIGAALCALFAAPALAGEPAKVTTEPVTLSLTQMDKVTAGWGVDVCIVCVQKNFTDQKNVAIGSAFFSQTNLNATSQSIN